MSDQEHIDIINEDEEKQISEDRTNTAPEAEPDVYDDHQHSTDSAPMAAQPLNPPEQIQIHLVHRSNSDHHRHPQSITPPEPNHSDYHHSTNSHNHLGLPPPPPS